ncbi:MAG: flippase [Pyrinomonadaceae bacterium]
MSSEPNAPENETSPERPSTAGMTTKVVKGTLWTLAGLSVPIFFSLFATPIVTRLLGAEGYGLFILVLLIPTYFNFADFGMNIASTKFGAGAYGEGSPEKEARVVRTAALIALIASLPFAIGIIAFSAPVVRIFNVPEHLFAEAAFALKLAAVGFVINCLATVFNTPELSRLRMDLNIMVTSGVRLLGIIATPIVIYLGGGVTGAVAVALSVSIITLAGHIIVSARLLPQLIGTTIDRDSVRPMLRFGSSLVIAGVAGVLLAQLEKVVLTRATSVETLAYYSVAATFAAMLTLFSASIVQSLMPAFSQLQGESNRPALNALYSRGIRSTLIWLVPAVVFMIFVGRPFFTYWFSADFGRESTLPFYITVAGLFFNVLAYFPYSAIMASGRSDIFAKIYWLELVPHVALVWVLAHWYGAAGAAAAWSIRVTLDAAILFWLAHRFGVRFDRGRILAFAAAALFMASPVVALAVWGHQPLVIASAVLAAVIYVFAVWRTVLKEEEIVWLKATVNRYRGQWTAHREEPVK